VKSWLHVALMRRTCGHSPSQSSGPDGQEQ